MNFCGKSSHDLDNTQPSRAQPTYHALQRSHPHLFKLLFGLQKFSVLGLGEINEIAAFYPQFIAIEHLALRWAAEMGSYR